jgi:hypothetical protein
LINKVHLSRMILEEMDDVFGIRGGIDQNLIHNIHDRHQPTGTYTPTLNDHTSCTSYDDVALGTTKCSADSVYFLMEESLEEKLTA